MTRRRLLIVDDHAMNRMILRGMLKDDYDITEAENGQVALDLLRAAPDDISAVLLDILMPVMDGYEVLKAMRDDARLSVVPVIVTTGSTDESTEIKALAMGANDFIGKPYNFAIARHRIRNAIYFRETAATLNATRLDELTGLFSRKAFFEKAAELIDAHKPGYYVLSAIDIDNFKVINDQFGNVRGDEVLKHIAKTYEEGFGAIGGICCRMTADKFAVLYPRAALGSDELDRIRAQAAQFDLTMPAMAISTGRYIVNETELSISAMYDRAVIAQATVKGRFDAHVVLYDESMRDRILQEQEIVNDMYDALLTNQFEPWFQPQFNHATGALIGAEALVRWRHPQKGLIPPFRFIPVFERNGFVYAMDKYIWESVCALLRQWTDEGLCPLPVSVNISRFDLFQDNFFDTVVSLIQKYDLPVDMLRLEITESAFMNSADRLITIVRQLVDYGFTVEIDDFGSGYSSLNTLKDVPANILKLDLRFLEDDDGSQRGGNILESVVGMSRWLGMPVIAEGVETLEQAEYLKSIGCFYVQGYLYSRPIPADEYKRLSSERGKERKMTTLKTLETLDNSAFWNPKSIETLIFNSFVGGACVIEYRDGKTELLRVNDKYVREIFGDSEPGLRVLLLNPSNFADDADRDRMRAAIDDAIASGDESCCEMRLTGLPGIARAVYVRFIIRMLARTGNRYMLYMSVHNVTAQRVAEQELIALNARAENGGKMLLHLMNDIPGGFARVQIMDGGKCAPLFVNDGFCKMTGMTLDSLIRIYSDDLYAGVHPDDRQRTVDAFTKGIDSGEPFRERYRLQNSLGDYIDVSVLGRLTRDDAGNRYLNLYYSDPTEQEKRESDNRKIMTDALEESERVLRMVAEHSSRIIYRYDVKSKVMTSELPNPDFGIVTFDAEVPEGAIKRGDVLPDSAEDYRRIFCEINAGVPAGSAKLHMRVPGGAACWFELKYSLFSDTRGVPQMALISFLDITEDHEKELAYERYRQSLEEDKRRVDVVYFDTDMTDDHVESIGGHLPEFSFPPVGGKHDMTVRAGISHLPDSYHESLWAFFSREHLLSSYAEGKCHLTRDWSITIDGKMFCFRSEIQMIEDPYSGHIRAYITLRDVTGEKLDLLDLQKQAETDGMTGLYNKTTTEALIRQALRRPDGAPCTMMIADLDNLKSINDTLGHPNGDLAIRRLADTLRAQFRRGDIVGRIGGDEMLVFLSDAGDESALRHMMDALMNKLESIKLDDADRVRLHASIGVAIGHSGVDSFEELYSRADKALYEVKRKGKNGYAFYGPSM